MSELHYMGLVIIILVVGMFSAREKVGRILFTVTLAICLAVFLFGAVWELQK